MLLFSLCLPNLVTVVETTSKTYRDGTIASYLMRHTAAPAGADNGQRGDITSYVISDQERTQEREVIEIGWTENRCPKYLR